MPTDVPDNSANPALVVDTPLLSAFYVSLTTSQTVIFQGDVSQYESIGVSLLSGNYPMRLSLLWYTSFNSGFPTLTSSVDINSGVPFYQSFPVLGAGVVIVAYAAVACQISNVAIWGMAAAAPLAPFLIAENSLLIYDGAIAAGVYKNVFIPPIIGPAHVSVQIWAGTSYSAAIIAQDYNSNVLGQPFYYTGNVAISSQQVSLPPYICYLSVQNLYTSSVNYSAAVVPG